MKCCAVAARLLRWTCCLLLGGFATVAMAQAQPAPSPSAAASAPVAEASDRQALLERLRDAQARLNDLEHNIRELERRLEPATPAASAAASAPEALASDAPALLPVIPVHWLWLGVLTIIILMIGITYSGRPARKDTSAPAQPDDDELAQFQNRLGGLDLSLEPQADAQVVSVESVRQRP